MFSKVFVYTETVYYHANTKLIEIHKTLSLTEHSMLLIYIVRFRCRKSTQLTLFLFCARRFAMRWSSQGICSHVRMQATVSNFKVNKSSSMSPFFFFFFLLYFLPFAAALLFCVGLCVSFFIALTVKKTKTCERDASYRSRYRVQKISFWQ